MDSATKILDIAERRIRQSGYNAVSYRDIADEMGIKSASLHYHFKKKEDLGVALVKRYAANLRALLSQTAPNYATPREKLNAYVDLHRVALQDHQLICLGAVLGAEALSLPETVSVEVRKFFEMNLAWLAQVYDELGEENPVARAKASVSALQGAMIVGSVTDDFTVFEAVFESVV